MLCTHCNAEVHPTQEMDEQGRFFDRCPNAQCGVPLSPPRPAIGAGSSGHVAPAHAPRRFEPQPTPARSASTLDGRIAEIRGELNAIEVMMARRVGLKAELKQLERAQAKAQPTATVRRLAVVGGQS